MPIADGTGQTASAPAKAGHDVLPHAPYATHATYATYEPLFFSSFNSASTSLCANTASGCSCSTVS